MGANGLGTSFHHIPAVTNIDDLDHGFVRRPLVLDRRHARAGLHLCLTSLLALAGNGNRCQRGEAGRPQLINKFPANQMATAGAESPTSGSSTSSIAKPAFSVLEMMWD
jgi:hypothetical protein